MGDYLDAGEMIVGVVQDGVMSGQRLPVQVERKHPELSGHVIVDGGVVLPEGLEGQHLVAVRFNHNITRKVQDIQEQTSRVSHIKLVLPLQVIIVGLALGWEVFERHIDDFMRILSKGIMVELH